MVLIVCVKIAKEIPPYQVIYADLSTLSSGP